MPAFIFGSNIILINYYYKQLQFYWVTTPNIALLILIKVVMFHFSVRKFHNKTVDQKKCPCVGGVHFLGPLLSVHLRELSAYERLRMQCLYVAGTITKCPLKRGVCLW